MPHLASLSVKAIRKTAGQMVQVADDLQWRLYNDDHVVESTDAEPYFSVPPGQYDLVVSHDGLQVDVTGIDLSQGCHRSELVFFRQDNAGSGDDYFIVDEIGFDQDAEFIRRGLDREGQRKFGMAARALSEPKSPGQGFGQQMGGEMGVQAHPLLSQKAQFDGIDAKVKPTVDENPLAAENEKSPQNRLAAQMKKQYGQDFNPKPTAY